MVTIVIIFLVLFTLFLLVILNGVKNEYEKEIDDIEQMKWIKEWNERKKQNEKIRSIK